MSSFLHKFNTDNVHSRAVIVGLLNLLNSKVYIENVLGDDSIDSVEVPFYYNMGGDERFLQDYYLHWNECLTPRMADGNYDVIPRGIVTLSSSNINTAAMTHRFVRGTYVKEVNGKIQQYNSFLNSIPLTMSFEVKIKTDSYLDAFKVQQSILETFYKVQVYSVQFKGFRVPCQVGFPEDYSLEKTFEFSYQSETEIFVNFSLTVETYFPIPDRTTERLNSNRMTWPPGPGYQETFIKGASDNSGPFTIEEPIGEERYFSGSDMNIAWVSNAAINRVNLFYRVITATGTTEWRNIDKYIPNVGSYDWRVPFLGTGGEERRNDVNRAEVLTTYGKGANVRAIVGTGGTVQKVVVLDQGRGYQVSDTIMVGPYSAPPRGVTYTLPTVQASVTDGFVQGAKVVNGGSGLYYTPENKIQIKVESAYTVDDFGVLEKKIEFTANATGGTALFNVSPSVNTLRQDYNLIGLEISGDQIMPSSVINAVDGTGNIIYVSQPTVGSVTGGSYITSSIASFVYVQ